MPHIALPEGLPGITSAFVDGLATFTPSDPAIYDKMGQRMATEGYVGGHIRD